MVRIKEVFASPRTGMGGSVLMPAEEADTASLNIKT